MLMQNILTPTGATLLSGPPLAWQQYVAREIVAAATPAGGHIIFLGDSLNDGLAAVRAFGNWKKLRQWKSTGPHLSAIAYHGIRSVQDLANALKHTFGEHDVGPKIIARDASRALSPMRADDVWPAWLPLLVRLVPAQYLTAVHSGVRGVPVTQNRKPFTSTWVLAEDFDPPPAQRFGERWRITDVSTGQIIRLHGRSYPSDMLFDLYEEPKQRNA